MLNATMLNRPAPTRCIQARRSPISRLRRRRRASRPNASTPSAMVPTRMLNGGISESAIRMADQLAPQPRLRSASSSRAVASSAPRRTASGMRALLVRPIAGFGGVRPVTAQPHADRDQYEHAQDRRQEAGPRLIGEVPRAPLTGGGTA